MRIFLTILQVLVSIALIVCIVMQAGKSAGLTGSIAGGAEQFFGKKKGLDELLAKATAWLGGIFVVLTLALSFI